MHFCVDDASCVIMTMANGKYYMFDLHSNDAVGLQNDKGQLYYYISKYKRDY